MAAIATVLSKPVEVKHAFQLLAHQFREMRGMPGEDIANLAIVKVAPKLFSVLNYSKGFDHADLIKV